MPEVGATLREARMRQRIDITDMETRTKIRAKYLRALENEEWDLLPGPTYVKSFLRTYADALGLDSRALVEEYKLRHERMETGELHPIRRPSAQERDRRRRPVGGDAGIPRAAIVGLVLAAVVALLAFIGRGNDEDSNPTVPAMPTQTQEREPAAEREEPREPPKPRLVRLRITPTAPVYVCLISAAGEAVIAGETLQPGQRARTFRSKRFRILLGNNGLRIAVNGRNRTVPPSPTASGYAITRAGLRELPAGQTPNCGT